MTREEFNNDINTVWELRDFCWDVSCEIGDEIYDADGRDDYIHECQLCDYNDSWQNLLRFLQDIPTGYDWYYVDDYGAWFGFDDGDPEFDEFKDRIRDWCDDNGVFDEEDEDEEDDEDGETAEPEYGVTDPDALEDEADGPSFFQLCHESSGMLRQLRSDSAAAARRREEEEAADEAEFARLLTMTMGV